MFRLQSPNGTTPYDSTPEQVVERVAPFPGGMLATFRVTDEKSLLTMLPLLSSTAISGCGLNELLTTPVVGDCSQTNLLGAPAGPAACGAPGS